MPLTATPAQAPPDALYGTRAATLLAVAEQLRLDGDYQAAREHAEQAAALAAESGHLALQADALRLVALQAARTYDHEAAVRVGRQALVMQRDLGSVRGEVETLTTLALSCMALSMYPDAIGYSSAAITGATQLGDDRLLCWALNRAGVAHCHMAQFDEGIRLLGRALGLARTLGADDEEFGVLLNTANVCGEKATLYEEGGQAAARGEKLEQAVVHFRAALEVAERGGDGPKQCLCLSNMVSELLKLGKLQEAEQALVRGRAIAVRDNVSWMMKEFDLGQADLLWHRGEPVAALAQLDLLLRDQPALAQSGDTPPFDLVYKCSKQLGQFERALAAHEQLLKLERDEMRERADAQSRLMLEQLALEQARREAAHARAELRQQTDRATRLEHERSVLERRAEELDKAAHIDALTGLANRRYIDEALPRLLAAGPGAADAVLSLAIADVDHFKQVNDSFGHAIGDRVLQVLGDIFRACTRGHDVVVRLGGEEFVLLLVGTPLATATLVCERVRAAVQAHDWAAVVPGLAVTISLGVGRACIGEGHDGLLRRADAALYAAKHGGRNRVVVDPT